MRRGSVFVIVFVMTATGCGGPNLGRVSGRVTVGGKPVTSGVIMFTPASGPSAIGEIKPDGSYTLTTLAPGDGAVVGAHRVTIQATTVGPNSMGFATAQEEIDKSGKNAKQPVLIPGAVTFVVPQKLGDLATTTLTADVKPGDNTCDFDLPKS